MLVRIDGAVPKLDNGACTTALCLAVRECVASLDDDGEAVDPAPMWRGILDGELQLVDRFASGGTRYLVLRPAPASARATATLTRRERQVLDEAVRGMDVAEIALHLGLSPSTVASHRARAFSKLGLAAHDLMLGPLARAYRMTVGSGCWGVVVLQPLAERLPDVLTRTERAVATMVVDGHSNAEIAASRGRSVRTIANQVAAVYRKLGVVNRTQLVMKLMGDHDSRSGRRPAGGLGAKDEGGGETTWLG
jgi:DNA-binding CsgD family transcriptional regulator